MFLFFSNYAMGTVSHMTEAEYLKVTLPMLVLICDRWKLSLAEFVVLWEWTVVIGRRRPCLADSYQII